MPMSPDERLALGQEFVRQCDSKIVICRAGQHRWPKMPIGRKRSPAGWSHRLLPPDQVGGRSGVVEITEVCEDCDEVRVTITAPGGGLQSSQRRDYIPPPGSRAPRGARAPKRMWIAELWRRAEEEGLVSLGG